jgi:hypothetical protein
MNVLEFEQEIRRLLTEGGWSAAASDSFVSAMDSVTHVEQNIPAPSPSTKS